VILHNVASNNCISETNGYIVTNPCVAGDQSQMWQFIQTIPGYYKVVGKSGNVWDLQGRNSNNGSNYIPNYPDGSDWQNFSIVPLSATTFKFVNKAVNKCTDNSGGRTQPGNNIIEYDCQNGNNNQVYIPSLAVLA